MKNLIHILSLAYIFSFAYLLNAQTTPNVSEEIPQNYKKRSPIYDYSETQLNSTDTIPDFEAKSAKLKITGTIYENDGVTPAKDVILFIYQADENGNFELKKENKKRYVHHRGWIKTDADGQYTFYTFVPGHYLNNLHRKEMKHIHPIIKEPSKPEYEINAFLFDDDPLLTSTCRKKLERKGIDNILKLDMKEGLFVAKRDIILGKENPTY